MLPVYKTVAGSKDITLDKNIDKEVTINTDANLSALIIRNLLDNAVKNAPEKSTIKIEITKKDKKLTLLIENDFHEHKLPVVTDIVANINDPEWELKRGVGLKFVMQTLKLLKASIQVSILNNKNRIRWYVEIPEP
jgi:K+-sensing histidine kinase KdpD